MNKRYKLKTIVTSSGERLPILLGRDGLPIFEPTVFSISEIRSRNRASDTIGSYLRSIMVFLLFLDLRGINLNERINMGQLLTLGEIEDLVDICRMPLEKINSLFDVVKVVTNKTYSKVVSLEKFRKTSSKSDYIEIEANSAATRLRNVREYLHWLSLEKLSKHGVDLTLRLALDLSVKQTSNAIESRLPSAAQKYLGINHREGLEPEIVSEILEVVKPQSLDNPWPREHSKYRNELIILLLLNTGLRRGELLNLRIRDLNFQKSTLVVKRRADDINDPRIYQPKVKTRAREIPLSAGLLDKINEYIMKHRAGINGARKHDFLIVASASGVPLSIPSLNKVFSILKKKFPESSNQLFPHIMRHTWNDNFSEEMDKNKVGEEQEKKIRSYLMGWSETSGTAATYTRRHVRKKAQAASLQLQKNIVERRNDE